MTGESAELEMVNIRVRRRAGAAPDMHPWPAGPRFRSSKGVLEKDLLYPGSACFGFHTVLRGCLWDLDLWGKAVSRCRPNLHFSDTHR